MDQDVLLDLVLRPVPADGSTRPAGRSGACRGRQSGACGQLRSARSLADAPFLGADVALLAWALRQPSAAAREEQVTLTPSSLRIAKRPGQDIVLNPDWVRVDMDERPAGQLTLWSHGKGVCVGTFLGPAERASLAQALRAALWRVRNGPQELGRGTGRVGPSCLHEVKSSR